MKGIIAFGIFLSLTAWADMEHKAGQEEIPSKERLSISRNCFRQADNLGCGHPRDDQGYFNACLTEKETELSSSCRAFFEKLYGKTRP